jgi:hypothetical protein
VKSKFPPHVHIVADEAYARVNKECNGQIMTSYSGLQLLKAQANDKENEEESLARKALDPLITVASPSSQYKKCELSILRSVVNESLLREYWACW